MAIFLEKNANLLGLFLKQYTNCNFFKSNFLYVLIIFKHPGQEALLVEENAMVRKMARIGSRHAKIVFKKSTRVRI